MAKINKSFLTKVHKKKRFSSPFHRIETGNSPITDFKSSAKILTASSDRRLKKFAENGKKANKKAPPIGETFYNVGITYLPGKSPCKYCRRG